MQRVILSILTLLFPLCVNGQLYNTSDYYVHDALAVNPAYAGSQDALSISLFNRYSWVGFDGAPKTTFLSAHAPLDNDKIGLGLFVMNDKIGVSKETSFTGNYAYRMDLGYGKLALGLGLGLSIQNVDWTKLAAQDQGDMLLAGNSSSALIPNIGAGIYYSTRKYFVGFSVPMMLSTKFNAEKDKYTVRNDFAEYNYFWTAGYVFNLNENFRFFPSVLIKYHKGNAGQIDINSQVIYKNKIWLGASYRSRNMMLGTLQFQVNNQFRIAYSYDFMVGNSTQRAYNAHEVMLNYIFNYQADAAGPRQF